MCKLAMQICSDFWKLISKTWSKKKKRLAAADAFPSLTDGEEDQKKEPNRATYTRSIIKIHWISSTG